MNRTQFLVEKWLETRSEEILDLLARELRPRTEYLARNFDPIYQEDLVQHALMGLRDALERYTLDKGFRFETYYYHRSLGKMLNYSRDHHRTIRVSRYLHDFIQKHSKFRERFVVEHLRQPTVEESAAYHGCTEEYLTKQITLTRQPYSLTSTSDIIQENPEHDIISNLANKQMLEEIIGNVKEGKSLAYLFDGDTTKGRRATKLVKKYLEDNR
jgi:DNA-directed RNA polymerase specialized sigma subunit